MNSIEELTQGWWKPSPGSIYPLLESLEQEGLVKKGPDGKYALTEKSRSELEWPVGIPGGPPQNVEGMLREIKGYVSYFEDIAKSERTRITPNAGEIRSIADRLLALVQERGEKT